MITFYKDKEKRTLNPTLFSDIAMSWADAIYKSGNKDMNKRSQLRKFFDEIIRLNALAKGNPDDWDDIVPFVNMVIAKTAYAEGRKKVSKEFLDFMKDGIGQIENYKDLDVFANFFEAFMGFYRKYGEK